MYYMKIIEDKVRIPPAMFGSRVEDAALNIVKERLERRIVNNIGLVLSIDKLQIMGEGIVIPGDGGAYYKIRFDAITFMPYVNEVYKAGIKEIVEFGAFCSIGPLQGLLHVSQISKEKFYYDKRSKQLTSKAEKKALKKGDEILVKVSTVSMKATTSETKIGLTMRPDGLGKVKWAEEKQKPAVKKTTKKKKESDKEGAR